MDPTIGEILDIDEIQEYDTEQLVVYLQSVKTLKLDKNDLSILKKEKYTSVNFLKITKETLHIDGLRDGPAERLANFAKEYNERKRIKSYGALATNSNKKMQREYVLTIFYAALRIIEVGSDSIFKMDVEYEINGKKYYRVTDYVIMEFKSGNLICITEDKIDRSIQEDIAQNIRKPKSSYDVNKKK
ncbi:hypothetical protein F8M41_025360 [Gigaspora margarita]|uniref:Uncharacterized protein n=1 Tax=Gigaspora margarita TaxID=4874 RepID=A0A8H3XLK6_GIGMA|nr:hypothetical protein F8M41_025360 [Gigaspora margarita]